MRSQSMLVALAAAPTALAHTAFTNFFVNGVSQGDGVAIRMNVDGETATNPIKSLDSNDMACNVGGEKGVARVQPVEDGSTLTFEIRAWPNDASKERIDQGHKGPCAVYLKKVDSAIKDQGHGDGWFKIFDRGYNGGSWCSDEIIANDGKLSVTLPKGLEGGYYLARPEMLALHAADKGDPQFYTGCAQIFVEGSGNLGPEETVSIPGYVKYGQESTSWNIYYGTDPTKYPLPGPKVAKLTSRSGVASGSASGTSQSEGTKPEGCIVENANWCGKEVPDWSDEASCWASGEDCWAQSKKCFDSAPPTGSAGCKLMQDKCTGIQTSCQSGDFKGPKNKGTVLTPKPQTIDVGQLFPTQGGGVVDSPSPKTPAAEAKTSAAAQSASVPKPTPVGEAQAPKEKPVVESEVAKPTENYGAAPAAPKTTITIPASEGAPAPTAVACPAGYECVTKYTTVVHTKVEYKTVYADYRRRAVHHRRHGHSA